jgi:hypothetical protein
MLWTVVAVLIINLISVAGEFCDSRVLRSTVNKLPSTSASDSPVARFTLPTAFEHNEGRPPWMRTSDASL